MSKILRSIGTMLVTSVPGMAHICSYLSDFWRVVYVMSSIRPDYEGPKRYWFPTVIVRTLVFWVGILNLVSMEWEIGSLKLLYWVIIYSVTTQAFVQLSPFSFSVNDWTRDLRYDNGRMGALGDAGSLRLCVLVFTAIGAALIFRTPSDKALFLSDSLMSKEHLVEGLLALRWCIIPMLFLHTVSFVRLSAEWYPVLWQRIFDREKGKLKAQMAYDLQVYSGANRDETFIQTRIILPIDRFVARMVHLAGVSPASVAAVHFGRNSLELKGRDPWELMRPESAPARSPYPAITLDPEEPSIRFLGAWSAALGDQAQKERLLSSL